MSEFGHLAQIGPNFCVDTWGAGPFILEVDGQSFRFEDSDRFGPHLVTKDGAIRSNPWPASRSPFWKAHRAWRDQGRRIAEDGVTCVFDVIAPRPNFYVKVGRRKVIIAYGDPDGDYVLVESPAESEIGSEDGERGRQRSEHKAHPPG